MIRRTPDRRQRTAAAALSHSLSKPPTVATAATLCEAATGGHLPLVQWCVEVANVPVDSQYLSSTPLMRACSNYKFEVVRWLLRAGGADVCTTNDFGCTAVHCAADSGHPSVLLEMLKQLPASMQPLRCLADLGGRTPIESLCQRGNFAALAVAVAFGACTADEVYDSRWAHASCRQGLETAARVPGKLLSWAEGRHFRGLPPPSAFVLAPCTLTPLMLTAGWDRGLAFVSQLVTAVSEDRLQFLAVCVQAWRLYRGELAPPKPYTPPAQRRAAAVASCLQLRRFCRVRDDKTELVEPLGVCVAAFL